MFSTLEATNEILNLLLLPLVDSTTLNTSRESTTVKYWLEKEIDYNLSLGWSFNTFTHTHQPTLAGEIILNDDIYRFNDIAKRDIFTRIDNKLYNSELETFVFKTEVKLRTIERVDISITPKWFINLVIADTAWKLRSILGGSVEQLTPHLQENLVRAKALAIQADIEAGGINYRNRSTTVKRYGFGTRFRNGYYL